MLKGKSMAVAPRIKLTRNADCWSTSGTTATFRHTSRGLGGWTVVLTAIQVRQRARLAPTRGSHIPDHPPSRRRCHARPPARTSKEHSWRVRYPSHAYREKRYENKWTCLNFQCMWTGLWWRQCAFERCRGQSPHDFMIFESLPASERPAVGVVALPACLSTAGKCVSRHKNQQRA